MHISKRVLLLGLTALALFNTACKKQSQQPVPDQVVFIPMQEVEPETHRWFYFTKSGFEETTIPARSPDYPLRPWTQAPRISGTLSGSDTAYLLVNRRGLVQLSAAAEPRLVPDSRLFSGTTADTLLTAEGNPVFKLYINTLFEEKVDQSAAFNGKVPVMVQYNPATNLYYPLISKADLKLPEETQITAMASVNDTWYFSAKQTDDRQTSFTYLSVPSGAFFDTRNVTPVSDEFFRSLWDQKPFREAPDRYKQLLSVIPDTISFTLSASDYSQSSRVNTPTLYFQGQDMAEDDVEVLQATGQTGSSWTMVLFSDGTCYFTGSLPKLHILNNGKPVYFRLPALPEGMEYTDFALCGSKLYAAWEELDFYNTGKAGFLEVDLAKVLY
ncbi:MAG: hypothetical protein MJ178_05240 [Treponemataceae bacterium]|nr:hypothetical protein [Treponemataceae bacterium]